VRRRLGLAVLAGLLALWTAAAEAQAASGSLGSRLDRALVARGVSADRTGAIVLDLETGEVVYERNGSLSLVPASNEKLTIAVAALALLGPRYRIGTDVLGDGARRGSAWKGDLYLRGQGDPTLHRRDLRKLARKLRAAGIRRVSGNVLGDESFFDAQRTAPGWKPSFYGAESAPLSALVVDRAIVKGRWVDDPASAAATVFARELEKAGIRVAGRAGVGATPPGAAPLAGVLSEPLAQIVSWMNQESDNFVAEMLLKGLGARLGKGGTTAAGVDVVRTVLSRLGVPLRGVRLVDGSGLSGRDRLTADALAALLAAAWKNPGLHEPFLASLAVAGESGTLEDRLVKPPARGRVFGKTGTTNLASSLSGYVGSRYAFAVIMNGRPIPSWFARKAQDRFVRLLARRIGQ